MVGRGRLGLHFPFRIWLSPRERDRSDSTSGYCRTRVGYPPFNGRMEQRGKKIGNVNRKVTRGRAEG